MDLTSLAIIELALTRVGEQLAFEGERFAIAILGGAALNMLGIVQRPTSDVDILAFGVSGPNDTHPTLREPPHPIPAALQHAIASVARDMSLEEHWMNTGPALQWRQGLPSGLPTRVTWRHYGPPGSPSLGLDVGVVARYDLIFFKLYAAADDTGPQSVHYQDLLALGPSGQELEAAVAWVKRQDLSPEFHAILDQVVAHVRRQLQHG